MNKLLIILLITASFFIPLATASNAESGATNPIATPTPKIGSSIEIEDVIIDRERDNTWCPIPEPVIENGCPKDINVKVRTVIKNAEKAKNLTYNYTVSGGRIIGQGEEVSWNFEDPRPGKYTITVGIGDKNGIKKKTVTKTFEFRECPVCDLPCECPSLDVSGGGEIKAGETVTFTAKVSGGTASDITYNWTISQGEIVAGQGTSTITVKTTKEMTGTITATVEIGGSLCASCYRTASETAEIIK
jgi:hypothetical protein